MHGSGGRDKGPSFTLDEMALHRAEWLLLSEAGQAAGAARQAPPRRLTEYLVGALTGEALASLELEGRLVDPSAMEACVRAGLGLGAPGEDAPADALPRGVADLLAHVLRGGSAPLTVKRIREIGGALGGRGNTSRLSAPKSGGNSLRLELSRFARWFSALDHSEAGGSLLACAGLAHLWFEAIQPFSFGSGILGRALAERVIFRPHSGMPFLPLSPVLLRRRNEYYDVLDRACRDGEATEWLEWFGNAVLEAARREKDELRALSPLVPGFPRRGP